MLHVVMMTCFTTRVRISVPRIAIRGTFFDFRVAYRGAKNFAARNFLITWFAVAAQSLQQMVWTFYGRAMSSTAPKNATRTYSTAVRCHLRHQKTLRARILRPCDVIYGTKKRYAHVFYGRAMSSTAPKNATRTYSTAVRCHLRHQKMLRARILRPCDVI